MYFIDLHIRVYLDMPACQSHLPHVGTCPHVVGCEDGDRVAVQCGRALLVNTAFERTVPICLEERWGASNPRYWVGRRRVQAKAGDLGQCSSNHQEVPGCSTIDRARGASALPRSKTSATMNGLPEELFRSRVRDALNKHGEGLSGGCWGSFVEIL